MLRVCTPSALVIIDFIHLRLSLTLSSSKDATDPPMLLKTPMIMLPAHPEMLTLHRNVVPYALHSDIKKKKKKKKKDRYRKLIK